MNNVNKKHEPDPTRARYLRERLIVDPERPSADAWVLTDAGLYVPKRLPSAKLRELADDALISELSESVRDALK